MIHLFELFRISVWFAAVYLFLPLIRSSNIELKCEWWWRMGASVRILSNVAMIQKWWASIWCVMSIWKKTRISNDIKINHILNYGISGIIPTSQHLTCVERYMIKINVSNDKKNNRNYHKFSNPWFLIYLFFSLFERDDHFNPFSNLFWSFFFEFFTIFLLTANFFYLLNWQISLFFVLWKWSLFDFIDLEHFRKGCGWNKKEKKIFYLRRKKISIRLSISIFGSRSSQHWPSDGHSSVVQLEDCAKSFGSLEIIK